MGLLGKLLKKPAEAETLTMPVCSHRILVARWDKVEDMGHEERITSYKCEGCGDTFTADVGRELWSLV